MSAPHMHQAGSVYRRLCDQAVKCPAVCCVPVSLLYGVRSPAKRHLESSGGESGAGQHHARPRLPVVAADLQGLCAGQRAVHRSAALLWHWRHSTNRQSWVHEKSQQRHGSGMAVLSSCLSAAIAGVPHQHEEVAEAGDGC